MGCSWVTLGFVILIQRTHPLSYNPPHVATIFTTIPVAMAKHGVL